jgi:hypothetical protein
LIGYKTFNQLTILIFVQLYKCSIIPNISTGLSVSQTFMADFGLEQNPAKNTIDGNKKHYWKVFEVLYFKLLRHYEQALKSKH